MSSIAPIRRRKKDKKAELSKVGSKRDRVQSQNHHRSANKAIDLEIRDLRGDSNIQSQEKTSRVILAVVYPVRIGDRKQVVSIWQTCELPFFGIRQWPDEMEDKQKARRCEHQLAHQIARRKTCQLGLLVLAQTAIASRLSFHPFSLDIIHLGSSGFIQGCRAGCKNKITQCGAEAVRIAPIAVSIVMSVVISTALHALNLRTCSHSGLSQRADMSSSDELDVLNMPSSHSRLPIVNHLPSPTLLST